MQDITSQPTEKEQPVASDRRREVLFLAVLGPFSLASFVAFFATAPLLADAARTIFLLAPLAAGGVWLAYEQMHDLVWWNIRPLCPACRRSFNSKQRPRPGMICACCDTPLYPLRTTQDYKIVILITTLMVIGLPVFGLWSSIVARLG